MAPPSNVMRTLIDQKSTVTPSYTVLYSLYSAKSYRMVRYYLALNSMNLTALNLPNLEDIRKFAEV